MGEREGARRRAPPTALCIPHSTSPAVVAVASEAAKPTILVAEKLGAGGVDMLKEVRS